MNKKTHLTLGDKRVAIALIALSVFGSMMIASAEMGNSAGDTAYLTGVIIRQLIYMVVGFIGYFFLTNFRVLKLRTSLYYIAYIVILGALIACRFFGQINGAYAWIPLPMGATIQPSEFAKVFMIAFGAKIFGKDKGENNLRNFYIYAGMAVVYFLVIARIQHDFGSAIVLFIICYCIAMIPSYKELRPIRKWMFIIVVGVIGLALLMLSNPVTEFLKKHSSNYMIGRFLAAADPFLYQFDNGYHIIMSLVSFANGGWFGLGYGNSIHKYMNFPNPSNDFILPVIVEELGIFGFVFLIAMYALMLYPIISASLKTRSLVSKMLFIGVFIYFVTHFILNVGGVSGLIPLTGVPLLIISSGGSSLIASMASLGLAQNELSRVKKEIDESNSRKIQTDANQNA